MPVTETLGPSAHCTVLSFGPSPAVLADQYNHFASAAYNSTQLFLPPWCSLSLWPYPLRPSLFLALTPVSICCRCFQSYGVPFPRAPSLCARVLGGNSPASTCSDQCMASGESPIGSRSCGVRIISDGARITGVDKNTFYLQSWRYSCVYRLFVLMYVSNGE